MDDSNVPDLLHQENQESELPSDLNGAGFMGVTTAATLVPSLVATRSMHETKGDAQREDPPVAKDAKKKPKVPQGGFLGGSLMYSEQELPKEIPLKAPTISLNLSKE